ncbi:MAG: Enoyl-[acyl-carrier-protein] reductase [NADH] FabI [Chlamydiae bacterium]|nr:Enoyl-[acyl-carrier-protein] reductase [NADH] FabI [Chlamydiota bacterium]
MVKLNLKGKRAFVAGIGDDQGYGWAIAKELAEAGAEIIIGTWPPVYKIFNMSLNNGKFDESLKFEDGGSMKIAKVYPLDAAFDSPEEVPQEISENKRYQNLGPYTISEIAKQVEQDFGKIDILVHSLANSPEIKNSLLNTSRKGYLAALSASSYSLVSMIRNFGPMMNKGGSVISMTFMASERAFPGYGGGMSSAKAALESDTRSLAFEAGREWDIRINTISAGPLRSRAARAIGDKGASFIDKMIDYSHANAPLQKDLCAQEVGQTALFLCSAMSSAITGVTLYVDNGLHAMGFAMDSQAMNPQTAEVVCESK